MISFIVTVLEKDTAAEIKKLEKLEQEHPAMVGNLSKITVVTSDDCQWKLTTVELIKAYSWQTSAPKNELIL